MVRRLPGSPIVNLRVDRLALVRLGGRLPLESHFTGRGPGSGRARRHHVVSVSRPHRKAVAGSAGCLRQKGTGEEDERTEELSYSSSVARSVNESWCRSPPHGKMAGSRAVL